MRRFLAEILCAVMAGFIVGSLTAWAAVRLAGWFP